MKRKNESINKLREILIEYLLSSKDKGLTKEELLEAAIWIHHIYQPETYEENREALQKVMKKRRKN